MVCVAVYVADKIYHFNKNVVSRINLRFFTVFEKLRFVIFHLPQNPQIASTKIITMGRFDRFCQSCGMPMEMDPQGGGTNADGSRNSKYCSHCYEKGAFHDNFSTPAQMVDYVRKELKKQGYGWFKRWFYTSHIAML